MTAVQRGSRLPRGVQFIFFWSCSPQSALGLVVPFVAIYLTVVQDVAVPWVGVFLGVFALASIAGSTTIGNLSESWSDLRVAQGGLVLQSVGLLLIGGAEDLFLLVSGMVIAGLGAGAAVPMTAALLVECTFEEQHPRAFAVSHWVLNLGIGAGALLGGYVVRDLAAGQFFALYALNAATYLLLAAGPSWVLRSHKGLRSEREESRPTRGLLLGILTLPVVWAVLGGQFLFESFGFAQVDSSVTRVLHELGMSTQMIGFLVASNTLAVILLQLPGTRIAEKSAPGGLLLAQGGVWFVAVLAGFAGAISNGTGALVLFLVFFVVFVLGEYLYSCALIPLAMSVSPEVSGPRIFALLRILSSASKACRPEPGGICWWRTRRPLVCG